MIKKLLRFWIISFLLLIQNLKIPQYKEQNPISDPVIRGIIKYRAHPSIVAIKENGNSSTPFNFSFVDKEDILKEIKSLKANKATKNTDIPTKLVKEIRTSLRILFLKIWMIVFFNQFSHQH